MGKPQKRYSLRLLEEKSRKGNSYAASVERKDTNPINQRKEKPNNQKPAPQVNLAEQDDEATAAVVEVNLVENKTE